MVPAFSPRAWNCTRHRMPSHFIPFPSPSSGACTLSKAAQLAFIRQGLRHAKKHLYCLVISFLFRSIFQDVFSLPALIGSMLAKDGSTGTCPTRLKSMSTIRSSHFIPSSLHAPIGSMLAKDGSTGTCPARLKAMRWPGAIAGSAATSMMFPEPFQGNSSR